MLPSELYKATLYILVSNEVFNGRYVKLAHKDSIQKIRDISGAEYVSMDRGRVNIYSLRHCPKDTDEATRQYIESILMPEEAGMLKI